MPTSDPPFFIEPLIGWRTWNVEDGIDQDAHGGPVGQFRLWTGAGTDWPARERLTARCRAGREHRSPEPGCACGIYAARTHGILRAQGYAAAPDDDRAPDVVGEVWLWGRILIDDEIIRAEHAYPKLLIVPHRCWRWTKPLAQVYGVPVEVRNPFTMEVD